MTYIHYWDYVYLNKILGEKPKEDDKTIMTIEEKWDNILSISIEI